MNINYENMLGFDEGRRLYAYLDTEKILTCGVGHNLDADKGLAILNRTLVKGSPITELECTTLFNHDLEKVQSGLQSHLPDYITLPANNKAVLVNMCFNIGLAGVLSFKNMIAAMRTGNINATISCLRNSHLYLQLPERVERLVQVVQGNIPKEYL